MTRKEELKKEIDSLRGRLLDNSRAIDAATRQTILDTIRVYKKELADIDSKERASSRTVSTVNDAPTGRTIVALTNTSNRRRIIGDGKNMTNIVKLGMR